MIHIHNGDVMAISARRAGIPGEHFAFRDTLVLGPVPVSGDRQPMRAEFISKAYGEELLRASNTLFEQEQALDAAESHDEIVLWFEHDLFCLMNFLYLLQRFRDRNVTFVWCSDPLMMREAGDVQLLFNSRAAATPAIFDIASRAWGAYTSPNPRLLNDVITATPNDLPFVRDGLRLHASRFPSVRNGLGSVENRLLKLIASGIADFGTLFGQFDADPPRFGYGDAQVLYTLRAMASRPVALILMVQSEDGPPKVTLATTPAGENVLNGAVDDIAVNDPDLWLGGTHVTKENIWRWDESRGEVIRSRSAGS
ncbi:MAG TPA: hypothetical protein VF980_02945 [Thermoanaerobaculia bacterium]